jgi:methyl-accepting chemotaxis protein
MGLRAKILMPIIGLTALLLSMSGWLSYQKTASELHAALVDNMRGQGTALVRDIKSMIGNVTEDIVQVGQRPMILEFYKNAKTEDRAVAESFGKGLQDIVKVYDTIERISLLDENGVTISSSTLSAIGQKFDDREYFKKAMAGETSLSEPIKSRVTGKATIIAATPIKMDGRIIGVAYASCPLDAFYEKFVKPVVVGKRGYAYILARNGQIVMHHDSELLLRDDLPNMPIYTEMAGKGAPGVKEYPGLTGNIVYSYFAQEPISGMTAVVQAETDDVFAGLATVRLISIISVVVAILLSALLVFLLLRPVLNTLLLSIEFAGRISEGDFSGKLEFKRSDELGRLADALNAIPQKLEEVLSVARSLAKNIRRGAFRERTDTKTLRGSYMTLAESIDEVAQSYTDVIDLFPPLMACDKSNSILFLNKSAQSVLQGNPCGTKCSEHLKAPQCNTDQCLGCVAMRDGSLTQETVVHPPCGPLDVSVSAVPIMSEKGKPIGYYEFLIDISNIKETQKKIMDVADEATEIARKVASFSDNLSTQVADVSQSASIQHERMESTASAVVEMNSTILEIAHNAANAAGQSDSTRVKAETGSDLVNRVGMATNQINKVSASLQENMRELGKRAEGIGGVLNVISDIADQTNLLALNAAIEAARAGDAGRGFAVVADEVRKLAEKTMSATQEVGKNITGIQDSVKVNIAEVEQAAKSISEATDLAATSGNTLTEILELATASSAVVASIATAAEEQSSTSEEISRTVEEVNAIINDSTTKMHEASLAVQELAKMSSRLNHVIEGLRTV